MFNQIFAETRLYRVALRHRIRKIVNDFDTIGILEMITGLQISQINLNL